MSEEEFLLSRNKHKSPPFARVSGKNERKTLQGSGNPTIDTIELHKKESNEKINMRLGLTVILSREGHREGECGRNG